DEAIAAHEKAASINPRWQFALGRSYALAGRTAEASAILEQLEAEPPSAWGAWTLAVMHTALGNFDEAFRWLAYEPAHAWLPWTGVMPEFEPLLDDPRFRDLRRRLDFIE
ncbi:MAG TPA: hypothetical protein VMM79_07280, partial [Longimicrobiales bacterium]|nr:hypothetical protein [Longimicrobiales bacterium]